MSHVRYEHKACGQHPPLLAPRYGHCWGLNVEREHQTASIPRLLTLAVRPRRKPPAESYDSCEKTSQATPELTIAVDRSSGPHIMWALMSATGFRDSIGPWHRLAMIRLAIHRGPDAGLVEMDFMADATKTGSEQTGPLPRELHRAFHQLLGRLHSFAAKPLSCLWLGCK